MKSLNFKIIRGRLILIGLAVFVLVSLFVTHDINPYFKILDLLDYHLPACSLWPTQSGSIDKKFKVTVQDDWIDPRSPSLSWSINGGNPFHKEKETILNFQEAGKEFQDRPGFHTDDPIAFSVKKSDLLKCGYSISNIRDQSVVNVSGDLIIHVGKEAALTKLDSMDYEWNLIRADIHSIDGEHHSRHCIIPSFSILSTAFWTPI
jgi:hypothetical protein